MLLFRSQSVRDHFLVSSNKQQDDMVEPFGHFEMSEPGLQAYNENAHYRCLSRTLSNIKDETFYKIVNVF